jgi:dinuclear metal center YbgI/SA1388 family protein
MRLSRLVSKIDDLIPPALAEDYDNVGLQLGDENADVKKAFITLDATVRAARRAKTLKCQLVITHHPLLFEAPKRITTGNAVGKVILQFIQSGIALFCAHTNFDSVAWGTNDVLAGLLGLKDCRPLEPAKSDVIEQAGESFLKFVVFVPESHLSRVQRAVFAAGGGRIGEYERCSWRTTGTGSFKPLARAHPAVGKRGKYEEVSEFRLEALVEKRDVPSVIEAVKKAHPYEEPAYDVYPLKTHGSEAGIGQTGNLKGRLSLRKVAAAVKRKVKAERVLVTGAPGRTVKRVAVCSGGGGSLIEAAIRQGADVFLTGEVRHHERLKCDEMGLALIEAGHFETEAVSLGRLRDRLQKEMPEVTFVLDGSLKNISRYV